MVCFICASNLNGQYSGIEILESVMDNAIKIDNAFYRFVIDSETEGDLFPINGDLYIKGESYFIDTDIIDQIYDGSKLYTIIHENQEILVTSGSNTFFNFTPRQLFNFFKDDFDIIIENNKDGLFKMIATNKIQDDIVYKMIIDSDLLSIKQIDLLDRDNSTLSSFLTLSYNFNLSLPASLFKFDKEKFNNYILVKDWRF